MNPKWALEAFHDLNIGSTTPRLKNFDFYFGILGERKHQRPRLGNRSFLFGGLTEDMVPSRQRRQYSDREKSRGVDDHG